MALEEFEREPMSERQKGLIQMRTITNYGMGIFIIVVGCFFMFPNRYTQNFLDKYDPALIKVFAVICWIYGIFRMYRDTKKIISGIDTGNESKKSYAESRIVFLCAVFVTACTNRQAKQEVVTDSPTSGTIQISADESFRPVIEAEIKVFEAINPGTKINAIYKPEAECLKDLFRDSATRMVIVTRGLTYKEAKYFEDTLHYVPRSEKLASDAIAVVVNAKSTDTTFTLQQLQQLLTGEANNDKKIVFDGLNATSAVRFAMDSILKGKKFDNNKVQAAKNSQEVLNYIASDENAIGFVGISWIGNPEDTAQVNMLKKVKIAYIKCDACTDSAYVKPTQAGIITRRYPLVRGLYYILKENYSGLGSGLASFMQYERGQLILRRAYLQPGLMSFDVRQVIVNEKLKKE